MQSPKKSCLLQAIQLSSDAKTAKGGYVVYIQKCNLNADMLKRSKEINFLSEASRPQRVKKFEPKAACPEIFNLVGGLSAI